jgi:ATP-dependent helicase/nuclease subunit A
VSGAGGDEQLGLFAGGGGEAAASAQRADGEAPAADREARRLAQREFERPLLVEAGAGTGKTTTLTARLLAWSLGPGWERAEARVREREAERHPLAAPSSGRLEPDPEAIAAETLSRVVAITFTEAAAAEMAKRAGETLSRLAHPPSGETPDPPEWLDAGALPPEPERSRRARALLGALDHLVVRTIHAFCRSLLAAHPLEAKLHPSLEVDADGSAVEEIAREAVEGRLASGYGDPGDPHLLALAAAGVGPADLVAAAVILVQEGARAADLETSPYSDDVVRELRDGLAHAAGALHAAVGGRLDGATRSGKSLEALASLAETVRLCAETEDRLPGFASLSAGLAEAWRETRERLRDWGRAKLNKTEADALGDAAAAVAAAAADLLARIDHLAGLDPELLEHGRLALAPVVAEVRREMRRRGVATFQDLLAEARDLLASRPDVAARARRRIDQLLVDELQDTDRLQCDVVAALGLDGPEEERPGLFLVGDPKQSIYGWRNADLRAYEELWRRVAAAGGRRLALSQNFRSVPAILREVAATVGPVMVERPGLQPRFEPLVPCERLASEPGFARGRWAPVEHWVSWRADAGPGFDGAPALAETRSGDATRLEAEAIARDLVRLHRDEGLPWSAAALLLRAFTDLDDYLDAFRRHGVPFAVTGDRQYYRRREVIDAAALVRAVLDPGDHLALLTLLRSPAVGVPDAALIPLWSEGLPARITELDPRQDRDSARAEIRAAVARAADRVPDPAVVPGLERVRGWEATLVATVECLAHLRRAFATEPADRFVEELRRRVPLEAVAAARYLGRYRLANLERFFRRLTEAMEASAGDVEAILRALRRGVAQAQDEEEGRILDPRGGAQEDAVQVMTIHKAKGLDFGHVYVPQMHKTSPPDVLPRIGVGVGDGGRLEYCLFGAPTPGFAAVADEARRVAAAERVRTLYVAMTRAEERLVLLGGWPEAPVPRPPEEAKSYLDLLAERFSAVPSVTELWQAAGGAGGRLDRHGVRWVFPALERAEPAEPGTAGALEVAAARPSLPERDAVAADAARLRELRSAAQERGARPVSAPASEEAHRRLDALAEARYEEGAGGSEAEELGTVDEREVALAVGSVVHRVLEELDLAAGAPEPAVGLARQRERLEELIAPHLREGEAAERARQRCETLLDRLERGALLARLAALRGQVVARELPVLLPPDPTAADGPVGFVSGALDLLYRDPDTGTLVVADYKTDRAEGDAEVAELARAYAPQARLYARAVQEALDLPEPPRAELWFLWPGRVEVVA